MAKSKITGAAKRIYRRNLLYHIFYNYVNTIFNHYYKKVEVHGLENIPRNEPVIFAVNHQNALMDALIVLFSSPEDTVFLARADLFKKKGLAFVLNSFKMLPVFRIRDGVEELGKNQEIFDITVGVLHRKHQLCLMPEGNHAEFRRLRRFGKGLFRIAFSAQEKMENKAYVKIVPVGLEFSDHIKHYQKLQVHYGKPIEVNEYWDSYKENGPRGLNELKQRLRNEMTSLMIHIETEEYYDLYEGLRIIYNDTMKEELGIEGNQLNDAFVADKEMIDRLDKILEVDPSKLNPLKEKTEKYFKGIKNLNIRDWLVKTGGYKTGKTIWRYLSLLLTLPIFLYGFVNNFFMYFGPVYMVRNIKDKMFHSSVKAGLSMLIFIPVFYTIQTLLVGIFTDQWWIWVAYLISIYPMGRLAIAWYIRLKKTMRGGWYNTQLRKSSGKVLELVSLRNEILEETKNLIGKK